MEKGKKLTGTLVCMIAAAVLTVLLVMPQAKAETIETAGTSQEERNDDVEEAPEEIHYWDVKTTPSAEFEDVVHVKLSKADGSIKEFKATDDSFNDISQVIDFEKSYRCHPEERISLDGVHKIKKFTTYGTDVEMIVVVNGIESTITTNGRSFIMEMHKSADELLEMLNFSSGIRNLAGASRSCNSIERLVGTNELREWAGVVFLADGTSVKVVTDSQTEFVFS